MKMRLMFFGIILAGLLIACSDDKGGGVAGNCPAGYVYTTNQQILNYVHSNYPIFNQGNQHGNQHGGQAIVQNYCVQQNAHNMAQQELGIGGGHHGGSGELHNYCDQYAHDYVQALIAGNPYASPNDPFYQSLRQDRYDFCMGFYSFGGY